LSLAQHLWVNDYQLAYFPGAAPDQSGCPLLSQVGTFTTFQSLFIQTEISKKHFQFASV